MAQTGAFGLLEQVRQRYAVADAYHDRGEVEWFQPGSDVPYRTVRFETVKEADRFRLELEIDDGDRNPRRVLWRDRDGAHEFEAALGQFRDVPSLAGAVARSLGDGGLDVLVVASALAGSSQALAEPEGAALGGRRPCTEGGDDTCTVLLLSRMAGGLESELWIDDDGWIREIRVTAAPPDLEVFRDVPRSDLPRRPQATPPGDLVRVRHRPAGRPPEPGLASFQPPAEALAVADWQKPTTVEDAELTFEDQVSVRLVSFRLHAVDPAGLPLPDLGPDDFEARLGEVSIPVLAVDWMPTGSPASDLLETGGQAADGMELLAPQLKRVILFVQAGREAPYISGHLRMKHRLADLLTSFDERDEVAVVSFDYHLKLWQDFTTDREAVTWATSQAIRFGARPWARKTHGTSLAEHLDRRAARKAATPEDALRLVGEALAPIDGQKAIIYLGWGLGRFTSQGVIMIPAYEGAVAALERARASVFVLDVTNAGAHSLEVGLQKVAEATGGKYFRTSLFPDLATRRLAATLSGHYVVTFDGNLLASAQRRHPKSNLDIELRHRRGELLGPALSMD